MRKRTRVALSSWLAAISEKTATAGGDDGQTTAEIGAEVGMSPQQVCRRILQPLALQGRVIHGRALRKTLLRGDMRMTDVYRIKSEVTRAQ